MQSPPPLPTRSPLRDIQYVDAVIASMFNEPSPQSYPPASFSSIYSRLSHHHDRPRPPPASTHTSSHHNRPYAREVDYTAYTPLALTNPSTSVLTTPLEESHGPPSLASSRTSTDSRSSNTSPTPSSRTNSYFPPFFPLTPAPCADDTDTTETVVVSTDAIFDMIDQLPASVRHSSSTMGGEEEWFSISEASDETCAYGVASVRLVGGSALSGGLGTRVSGVGKGSLMGFRRG
jgi:hypothetical protein